MVDVSKFFQTFPAYDGVTAIEGVCGELCFLIRGREKALLVDTLTGVGSLRPFCEGLTGLPITVVNTHGHVDHVGSSRMDRLLHLPAGRLTLGEERDAQRDVEHGHARDAGILPACPEGVPPSASADKKDSSFFCDQPNGTHDAGETPAPRCTPRTLEFPDLTFAAPIRTACYRMSIDRICSHQPDLPIGLCLEETSTFEALGLSAMIGRCNCVL